MLHPVDTVRRTASLLAVLVTAALCVLASPAAAASAATPADAGQIDAYLVAKGSPMAGQGAAFVASGGRWQVDPRLLVAIAGAESSFGQITCAEFNAWGWGCPNGPYEFTSWADGIDTVTRGLRTGYLAEGRTSVAAIHQKYAPVGADNDPTGLNNNWTINVSRFIVELGGDPNDLDMDGVAGSLPLGPVASVVPLEQFAFTEPASTDAPAEADEPLRIVAGTPRPLVVHVTNSGSVAWSTQDVRLRRVDVEPRVVGASFGALVDAEPVQPGARARFVVQLAAAGTLADAATTVWRLEGPAGPFGGEIARPVAIEVPALVAGESRVEVAPANGGVAGSASTWTVLVHVRNGGRETWVRDAGDPARLDLVRSTGSALVGLGWVGDRTPATMLEREVAPGEEASFAFRASSDGSRLELALARAAGRAAGEPIVVELGSPPPAPAAAAG